MRAKVWRIGFSVSLVAFGCIYVDEYAVSHPWMCVVVVACVVANLMVAWDTR